MGDEKIRDFRTFARRNDILAEDNCFIFVGDNGQGDAEAGVALLKEFPTQLAAVFIHVVPPPIDDDDDGANFPKLRPASGAVEGVVYFRTAIGAAVQAYCARMISFSSLVSQLYHF